MNSFSNPVCAYGLIEEAVGEGHNIVKIFPKLFKLLESGCFLPCLRIFSFSLFFFFFLRANQRENVERTHPGCLENEDPKDPPRSQITNLNEPFLEGNTKWSNLAAVCDYFKNS